MSDAKRARKLVKNMMLYVTALKDGKVACAEAIMEAFHEIREAEREECAAVAERASVIYFAESMGRNPASDAAQKIAKAIRDRRKR